MRRIGQTETVMSVWITGFPMDKKLDRMLLDKLKSSEQVLSDSGGGEINWFEESAGLLQAMLCEGAEVKKKPLGTRGSDSAPALPPPVHSRDIRHFFGTGKRNDEAEESSQELIIID